MNMMDEKSMETDKPFDVVHLSQGFDNCGGGDGVKSDNFDNGGSGSRNSESDSGSGSGSLNREIMSINQNQLRQCGSFNSDLMRNGHRIFGRERAATQGAVGSGGSFGGRSIRPRALDDGVIGMNSGAGGGGTRDNGDGGEIGSQGQGQGGRPSRACPSPVSSIVGNALNQMHLKRSSSAPMINQLGIGGREISHSSGLSGLSGGPLQCGSQSPSSQPMSISGLVNHSHNSSSQKECGGGGGGGVGDRDGDIDASALASSFLSTLGGPRPRRFSASFSPGSPGLAPNRVSQLRHENTTDWETMSEKEFHGTSNIAQSWEDLSLDSMSMEVGTRRPSISDQLWLSMPTSSAPSSPRNMSPAASPRVLSRFSPSLSSPSPTRKSFTTRRSLSPIAVRPSVLAIGQGVKRKCDWDSNSSNQMDCSPQPAKRSGGGQGLLGFNSFNHNHNQGTSSGCASPVSQYSSGGGGGTIQPQPQGFVFTNTSGHSHNSQPIFPGLPASGSGSLSQSQLSQSSSGSGSGSCGGSPFNPISHGHNHPNQLNQHHLQIQPLPFFPGLPGNGSQSQQNSSTGGSGSGPGSGAGSPYNLIHSSHVTHMSTSTPMMTMTAHNLQIGQENEDSPFSLLNETDCPSSVSSVHSLHSIGGDSPSPSPFFRPLDSPLAATSPEDSPRTVPK